MRRTEYKRRRRRGCCAGGVFKFIFFLFLIILAAYFLGRGYFDSDISDKIKRTQYPIKYEHFVEKYSNEYGLDKYLVYAVMRTESRFDKFAVSNAGAKGLMQITDETGEDCARRLRITGYSDDALFDPEINIEIGCYYLKGLLDKYDNVNNALAAYNGGPGNVDKWLLDPSYVDGSGTLVNIPFKETRNYVVRVNEAREMYKSIYEDGE